MRERKLRAREIREKDEWQAKWSRGELNFQVWYTSPVYTAEHHFSLPQARCTVKQTGLTNSGFQGEGRNVVCTYKQRKTKVTQQTEVSVTRCNALYIRSWWSSFGFICRVIDVFRRFGETSATLFPRSSETSELTAYTQQTRQSCGQKRLWRTTELHVGIICAWNELV